MSQIENAVTSSSVVKRAYRKGKPLSEAERQRVASVRRRSVCKEIKVFVRPELKNYLTSQCAEEGITQAELIERLIEKEVCNRNKM
ncbi:replication regulatory protein RepA [Salmonella enterica]|nr:replication regulatory protein RepA [Salmonella enterica]ELF4914110.1 replication regulatory protein RepA [Salmonella enterica]